MKTSLCAGVLTAVLFVFAMPCVFARNTGPESFIGKSYLAARKTLIREGWVPAHVDVMERDKKLQRQYPELDACAVDRPMCSFSFTKHGKCLRVTTVGEEPAYFTVSTVVHDCLK